MAEQERKRVEGKGLDIKEEKAFPGHTKLSSLHDPWNIFWKWMFAFHR